MRPSVVALGTFDGMHIGHRAVIETAVALARSHGMQSVVYTFENHPRSVFGRAPVTLLMSTQARRDAMLALGVDVVDMVWFDRAMAAMSAHAFLTMLTERIDTRVIVCGSDFTFGHKGEGRVETLEREKDAFGYVLKVVPFVMLGGEKVSSTRIRDALAHGDEALAREMLGGR